MSRRRGKQKSRAEKRRRRRLDGRDSSTLSDAQLRMGTNAMVNFIASDVVSILIQEGDEWVVGRLPGFSARTLRSSGGQNQDLVSVIERVGSRFATLEDALSNIREFEESRVSLRDNPEFVQWFKQAM